MNTIDITGRCAIISGGAQGIGLAIAKRILGSGASVSHWDDDQQLLRAAANGLQAQRETPFLFRRRNGCGRCQQAVSATAQALSRIDVLVNVKGWDYRPRLGLALSM